MVYRGIFLLNCASPHLFFQGVSLDPVDPWGVTPLSLSIMLDKMDQVACLLEAGASPLLGRGMEESEMTSRKSDVFL